MKKYALFFFLLLLSTQLAHAQQMLIIKKLTGKRRYEFYEGERIRLKQKDNGEISSGNWQYAGRHSIKVNELVLPLSDIQWIDVSRKEKGVWALRKGQDLLLIAGLGYFTVVHINVPIETGRFGLDREAAQSSLSMLAGSFLCWSVDRVLRKRHIPINSRRFNASLIDMP